jgi:hypothetical protein
MLTITWRDWYFRPRFQRWETGCRMLTWLCVHVSWVGRA